MKHILPLILLILISLPVLARDWNEYYFQFEIQNKSELEFLTEIISIAKVQGTVKDVYANPLSATITILGLDVDYSTAITDPACGDYIRMLLPGIYNVQISGWI